ncbi:MAG: SDR family NAD(P)-dependent oxidoreductase [Alphaproteobacteria bacterium]|nr:MAG: SDR family NAD(P)-dependent oxidoreductase [Alphaproteobacteria bacterium]
MTPASAARAQRPIVLVTGGSRGIGLALARGFAARGHDLILVARDAERLQRAAAAIAAAHGVSVEHVACDLAEPDAVARLMAAIADTGCYVNILVNCAGVGASGAFASSDPHAIRRALHLNIDAATALMHACLPAMVARRSGGVLNVASLAGMLPMPYLALYGATKSYLFALSRAAAWEAAGSGVTVSALLPGPVDTGFFAHNMHADRQRTGKIPGLSPEVVARTAIEGYLAGQTVITPGMLGWLCRLGLKLLPRRIPAAFVRGIMRRSLSAQASDSPQAASHTRPAHEPSSIASAGRQRLRRLLGAPSHVLVLGCIAVVLALQVGVASRKAPHIDSDPRSTVAVAAGLLEHGVFVEAFVPVGTERPAPGRYLAPGYPAIVAGVAALDEGLARAIRCLAASQADCVRGNPFRSLIILQALFAFLVLALVCLVARELSGSVEIAALATLLTFLMSHFGELAGLVIPYAIVPEMALTFCALLFTAHRRRSILAAALGGLVLGVLALTEVYYAALVALAPLLLLWAESKRGDPNWRFGLGAAAVLAVAASLVLGPWMLRNYVLFGDIALTHGTETKLLAERVAYMGSSAGELLVGLFFYLPGLGDLSSLFLPAETTRKFDIYYEGSLLLESGRILSGTPPTAGESQFWRLLDVYAFGSPADYVLTTALLIVRGLRATGGWLVLWGWLALPVLLRRLAAQRELGPFLLIAGPLFGLTVVQSLLTANLPWMNVPLVFVYGYAIARATGGLELPFALRRLLAAPDAADGASSSAPEAARRPELPRAR